MNTTEGAIPAQAGTDRGVGRKSILIAAFGTVVEWYDFTLYLYLAPVLARVFFGGSGDSLVLTFALFAAAYLMRPIGAMVFGHYGDRLGRRKALMVSAALMAVAMAGTAVLPGSASIGWLAVVLLLLLRCLMGVSVGGEFSGILIYLMESAKPRNRGYAASWASANSEIGALLAVGVAALLSSELTQAQVDSWGWRVAFGVGAVLAAMMLLLRKGLRETPVFERIQATSKIAKSPLLEVLRTQRPALGMAFAITTISAITYYLNITYVSTFLTGVGHATSGSALQLSTVAALVVLVVTPFFGWLSDRTGRRPMMIWLTVITAVTTPALFMMLMVPNTSVALAGAVALAIPAAALTAVTSSAIPEQFAAAGRFSAMAIGYNTATAIFGGLSPLIATLLINTTGWQLAPAVYVSVIAVLVLPIVWRMKETARIELPDTATAKLDLSRN